MCTVTDTISPLLGAQYYRCTVTDTCTFNLYKCTIRFTVTDTISQLSGATIQCW